MLRALYSGVSGMSNHQQILDITANNLANVSTPGYKGSRITFATALNQTQSAGNAPGTDNGGTNPRQVGLGVTNASIDVDMKQGALTATGRAFDLSIQGEGFFRVNNGVSDFYTRVGNFGWDSGDKLVDLSSGMNVQGLQNTVLGDISLSDYRSATPTATDQVTFQGNLSAKSVPMRGESVQSITALTEVSPDGTTFTTASEDTDLDALSIYKGAAAAVTVYVFGSRADGTPYSGSISLAPATEKVSDLLDKLNTGVFVDGVTGKNFARATLDNGVLTFQGLETGSGFSAFLGESNPTLHASGNLTTATNGLLNIFSDAATQDVNQWQYANATNAQFDWYQIRMAPEVVSSSIDVYDSTGTKHTVEYKFFATGSSVDAATGERTNYWDMVANVTPSEGSISGNLVAGVQFDSKGRYLGTGGLGKTSRGSSLDDTNYRGQPADEKLSLTWNTTGPTELTTNFGDPNSTTGLTGFGSNSSAAAISQDGYAAGTLESFAVQSNGEIRGIYSNGKAQTIAQVRLFKFTNPQGLLSSGTNMWSTSNNSGSAQEVTAGDNGAGTITSGALEASNVDIASEFTRLITAQRGFQVSARVMQTTDQILQELSGLIR